MDDYAERPRTKLPQGRHYLKAARWGFEEMVKHQHLGSAFVFHIVGILTMLRGFAPSHLPSMARTGRFPSRMRLSSAIGGSARTQQRQPN